MSLLRRNFGRKVSEQIKPGPSLRLPGVYVGGIRREQHRKVSSFVHIPRPTIEFITSVADGTNATEFTFSAVSLGTPDVNRKIAVVISGSGGGTFTVSGVTIDGITASEVVAAPIDSETITYIYQAEVPNGESGDIVVTWTGSKGNTGLGVYAVYNAALVADDTMTSNANPGTGTINVPRYGIIIGGYSHVAGAARTNIWDATIDEDYDEAKDTDVTNVHTGASKRYMERQTGITITATPSGTTTNEAMAVASWGPI